jgi:hypothetical protein
MRESMHVTTATWSDGMTARGPVKWRSFSAAWASSSSIAESID